MVVDASAIVAVLAREPEREAFIILMFGAQRRITHGVSIWEAATAISRLSKTSPTESFAIVEEFLNGFEVVVATIGLAETTAALDAFKRYGRASSHPAKLNLGDCFSYGIAQTREMPLLYKGNDFGHTPFGW